MSVHQMEIVAPAGEPVITYRRFVPAPPEYLEVVRPSRLVMTFIYEGMPDAHSVDALNFDATEGGTLLQGTSTHSSVAARDQHVAHGMEAGLRESYERLDACVDVMQARG